MTFSRNPFQISRAPGCNCNPSNKRLSFDEPMTANLLPRSVPMSRLSWAVLSLFLFAPCASAQSQLLLRNPALSRTQIAFSYAGDLWADNVYSFFEGTAGKSVVLRVGPEPGGAN